MATAELPLQRQLVTSAGSEEFPPRQIPTGYETRAFNDPEREPDVPVMIPLITDEIPVLWKGGAG